MGGLAAEAQGRRVTERRLMRLAPTLALVLAALVIAACGGRGGRGGTAPPPPAGRTLTVEESEFKIVPPDLAAQPGRITFQIKNVGTVEHNFVVAGTTVSVESIPAGRSTTVTADLAPGTYRVACTVPGHEEAGMVGTLTVAP